MFAWNTKKVKTVIFNPERGNKEIIEMSAKDIVANPNRHQFESIISALSVCVSELIRIEELNSARIAEIQNKLHESKKGDSNGNESVQNQVSESH